MEKLILYGVPLFTLIAGVVVVAKEKLGLSSETSRWLKALLAGGAVLLILNAAWLESVWPPFRTVVVQAGAVVGVVLTIAGYLPYAVVRAFGLVQPTSSVAFRPPSTDFLDYMAQTDSDAAREQAGGGL